MLCRYRAARQNKLKLKLLAVERPAVLSVPADVGFGTNGRNSMSGGVWHFDNKIFVAMHIHAAPNVVAQIDQFQNLGVDTFAAASLIQNNPFRANRKGGSAANVATTYRQGFARLTIVKGPK